jgi:cellulose synthase/poly-beta-1,6-N-acetylglucosamine synthase-like glycosyltransferase
MDVDNDSYHDGNEHDSETEVSPVVESFKGSIVWHHFTKDPDFKENKKATCNYCSKVYICSGGSTTNVKKHLNKHNIQTSSQNQDIRELFSSSKVNFKFLFYFL